VIGWAGDFFRFWWSLFYWNLRKTIFRWRGGRCPCQNPSDSGRARETSCDASGSWHRPARFRRVCPLLTMTAQGLRCAADTKDVRPFWGRALAFCGGGAATAWLVTGLGAFAVLRGVGYPVRFAAVAWPPDWREIRPARAEYFYEKATRALAASRVNEALMDLSYASNLNPRNFQAGLLLAKLCQVGQPVLSDQLYARLLHDDPDQAALIAHEWYGALLARGDFPRIIKLAPAFLTRDAANAAVWLNAFFFATRRLGDPEPLRRLLATEPALPANLRRLGQIELWAETGRTGEAHDALSRLPLDTAYAVYYQATELTALGFPDEALLALDRAAALLPGPEYLALRLDAYAAKGWRSLVQNEIEFALSPPVRASLIESLCAHLIRHPDAELVADLFARLQQNPLPPSAASYQATLALFCAAGANADWPDFRAARNMLRQLSGAPFKALDTVESFFRDTSANRRIGNVLPLLQPLDLDVTYALFEHYGSGQAGFRPPP